MFGAARAALVVLVDGPHHHSAEFLLFGILDLFFDRARIVEADPSGALVLVGHFLLGVPDLLPSILQLANLKQELRTVTHDLN